MNSFQWACMLKSLASGGVQVTLSEALNKYKMHPAVVAYSVTAAGATLDSESGLIVDKQKDVKPRFCVHYVLLSVHELVDATPQVCISEAGSAYSPRIRAES